MQVGAEGKMAVVRTAARASLIDVLDRVLDKGIVIDAWVRVSVIGIDLITVEAHVTVASIETYLKYADLLTHAGQPSVKTVPANGDRPVIEDRVPLAAPNTKLRAGDRR